MSAGEKDTITLIYDGKCPFCSGYARYMRLKETAGQIILVNARDTAHPSVQYVTEKGYDLDQGMVAIIAGKAYHGANALHALALLSSNAGLFNRMNYTLFRSMVFAKFSYPVLKLGRTVALMATGSDKINNTK